MRVLVTGATGYIGGAAARALLARGHEVLGLTRSAGSADRLRQFGITPVGGDFGDAASLSEAIGTAKVDAVVSTASTGSKGDTATTFAQDRDAVQTMQAALGDSGKPLIFTSGSAVFGVFNGGNATDIVYDEDAGLPLPRAVFAPAAAKVHPMLASGFGAAMAARIETENVVTAASGVRGIVVRPGLVYGHGGSADLPAIIRIARENGRGAHFGPGGTLQSYVHIDDLAELYCLAVERAPAGAILHGVVDDVSHRELAAAAGRMLGLGDRTDEFSLEQMLGMRTAARIGLRLTQGLPPEWTRRLQGVFTPPPSAGSGISLSLNKRLASEKTRELVGWAPTRRDILEDLEFGSYVTESSVR
jgi:nucleoside-diphosphate-sugar epimerase